MSSQTERLEKAAAEERERLALHLENLQNQIERAVDPKMLYERYPLTVLGAAMFAGVVLGAVTKGDGRRSRVQGRQRQFQDDVEKQTAWGELRGAVMGMVAARLGDMLYNMVSHRLTTSHEEHAEDTVNGAARHGGDDSGRVRTATA